MLLPAYQKMDGGSDFVSIESPRLFTKAALCRAYLIDVHQNINDKVPVLPSVTSTMLWPIARQLCMYFAYRS